MFKGSSNKLRSAFGGFVAERRRQLFSYVVDAFLMFCNAQSVTVYFVRAQRGCARRFLCMLFTFSSSIEQLLFKRSTS